MKKKRRPDKSDLEAIRDQILDFACSKHDFKLETDNFLPEGDWNGVFIVKFKDNPKEDRLYSRAWVPNFSQRIFGLTLSNLMDCKDAVLLMLSKK